MPNPAQPTDATAYENVLEQLKELLPRNYIGGLITSNDADAAHDVNITAGECRDPTDAVSLRLATEITKQIDAVWAVGDDAGGIDAGAVGADTLYAVWLIKRSDTGVVDALFSLSFTAPTMPANYDYKRLIGSVMTDGAADIIAFTQSGDYFRYTSAVLGDVSDATITSDTPEIATLSVPPSCLAHIYGHLTNQTTTALVGRLFIRTNGAAEVGTNNVAFALVETAGTFDRIAGIGTVLVDSSSQIQYTATEADGTATVEVTTLGFTMLTRREP